MTKSSQFAIPCIMKTISIYEAKTNFSKIVKNAKKGKITYVGAFGKPEAMITPIPKPKPVVFGILKGKLSYDICDFTGEDPDIQELFYGNLD